MVLQYFNKTSHMTPVKQSTQVKTDRNLNNTFYIFGLLTTLVPLKYSPIEMQQFKEAEGQQQR